MAQEAYAYPNDGGTFLWNTALNLGYPASGIYTPFGMLGYDPAQPGFTRVVFGLRWGRRLGAIFISQPPA